MGIAARDHGAQGLRPARRKDADIAHGIVERLRARIHDSQHYLVLQHEIVHDSLGVEIDRRLVARHAGENIDAVRSEMLQHFERELRRARGFVNQVDVAHLFGHLFDGCLCGRNVPRADSFRYIRFRIRLGRPRIDVRFEARIHQHHGPQQSHRPGTQDHRAQPAAVPMQPLLDFAHLDQRLLRDGQRLHQHRHIPQFPGHRVQVMPVLDHELGHESVQSLDAVLAVVAGHAEVVVAGRGRRCNSHPSKAGARCSPPGRPRADPRHPARPPPLRLAIRGPARNDPIRAAACRRQRRRCPCRCRIRLLPACAASLRWARRCAARRYRRCRPHAGREKRRRLSLLFRIVSTSARGGFRLRLPGSNRSEEGTIIPAETAAGASLGCAWSWARCPPQSAA